MNEQSIRDEIAALLESPVHAPISTHDGLDGACLDCPWPLNHLPAEEVADAILASPVIRRIQADAWDLWEDGEPLTNPYREEQS